MRDNFGDAAGRVRPAAAWRNPPQRTALPVRLSSTFSTFLGVNVLLGKISEELAFHGRSLADVRRIYIAYPHKDPDIFPAYKNGSSVTLAALEERLRAAAPSVSWRAADGICETVRLDRSEDQSSLHALTSKQVYRIREAEGIPGFLAGHPADEPAFFIVADTSVEQGTTIANLASYIHHNGGIVLAAAVPEKTVPLAQRRPVGASPDLPPAFSDPARNNGRAAELAQTLAATADGLTPAACLTRFESALNACGNSLFAMTDGECAKLIATLRGETPYVENFRSLVARLERLGASPAPRYPASGF